MFTNPSRATTVSAIVITVSLLSLGCNKEPSTPDELLHHSFAIGDWNTTVALCDQMLERNPNDIEIVMLRGRAHLGAGSLEDAVRDFTHFIELRPEDPEGYYHREIAYRKLGQLDLASRDGQTARTFDTLYKSAYAYDPSNFQRPVDLSSVSSRPTQDSTSDKVREPFDETIFSDDTGFEPDETSRVLAAGTPTDEDNRVRQDAADIGVPKAPQIVHDNFIPKLADPSDDDEATDSDNAMDGDKVARFNDLQFPANPTLDDTKELEIPDLEPVNKHTLMPELTTSLPTDPSGNLLVPGASPGTLSTGLPSSPSVAAPSPNGLSRSPLATGLNAPTAPATGLNAPYTVNPPPAMVPPSQPAVGTSPNSIDPVFVPNIGLSGLPLPNGATGLPTDRTGQQFVAPGSPTTDYRPTAGQSVMPQTTPYHGNPIFDPNEKPVITTSLPGYPTPNSVVPNNAQGQGVTLSTNLSDTVLQNRLSRPTQSRAPDYQFRSLQQQ